MKTALLFLFLVLAYTSAEYDLVDIEGNLIRNGGSYYILPAIWGRGGGVGLAPTGHETCPLTVVQTYSQHSNGLPTILSSPYKIAFLPTNFIMEFTVVAAPKCASQPAKWTIIIGEDNSREVKLAGYYEHTISGFFKIQRYHGATYKIVFCPASEEESCVALGIEEDSEGNRRFVFDDEKPFAAVFLKAESSAV